MRVGRLVAAASLAAAALLPAAATAATPTPPTPAAPTSAGSAGSTSAPAGTAPAPVGLPSPTSAAAGLPLTVTLGGLSPLAPQLGQTLVVRGTLRNVSSTPVSEISVHLSISRTRVGSRGEFQGYAADPAGPPPTDAVALPAQVALGDSTLAVAAAEPFSVSVPVDALQLPLSWQVYELAVTVTGLTPPGTGTVGRLRTFLPWAPLRVPGVGQPTKVAWVWPLVDRPHRTVGSDWTDDGLAGELGPGGRLDGLVQAASAAAAQRPPPPRVRRGKHGKRHRPPPAPPTPTVTGVPVTWAIDPMLVEDARLMAGGYRVHTAAGTRPGKGASAAAGWLAKLRSAAGTGQVLALPYGDPDLTAAVHAGFASEVQVAAANGQTLLKAALGSTPLTTAWPPGGFADQRTLDVLYAAGQTSVVLDSTALPVVGGEPSETPGAHTTVRARDGNLDAALSDDALDRAIDLGATDPAQAPLELQRVLSELLMIQAERPSDQRSIVLAPDRRWDPTATYAGQLLAATGRVPWVLPVTLSQVIDGPTYDVPRGPLTYPAAARAAQLSRGYLEQVHLLGNRVDALASVLGQAGLDQSRAFDAALLRLLSSAWRGQPAAARAHRDAVSRDVSRTMNRIHIASHPRSLVTLTSHSGIVPVTVANDLDTDVQVEVRIDAGQHLVVSHQDAAITIQAHRRVPVDVRATARTSGVFPIFVTLYTPQGKPFGRPIQLFVRSTAYGATALLITGGATAVLLLAVVVRLVRRARAARRAAQPAG